MNVLKKVISFCILFGCVVNAQQNPLKVLNFQGDNGYVHDSKEAGKALIEALGAKNNWEVVSTTNSNIFNTKDLFQFDVVIFNNNCGNEGAILTKNQQQVFQNYIKSGGGFVGIHCAGAIFNEGGTFQQWYEKLIGARLTQHPKVQKATVHIENRGHAITKHFPEMWEVEDEWHAFAYNPRPYVNVLMSVDETSYEGTPKMNEDHPITWYQYYDGGRTFFTTLGHTKSIYSKPNYRKLIEEAIVWVSQKNKKPLPITSGLLLDLDANNGIVLEDGNKITSWKNKVSNAVDQFVKQDKGRETEGSGRPRLVLNVSEINSNNTVVFHRQELVNHNEDAFDHLTTGSGHTWFSVMCVYEQVPDLPGVSSFFGNLRNNNTKVNGGKYEGFWGGLTDDNRLWYGARNAVTFGRWDDNNPQLLTPLPLVKGKYYLVMGRMGAGTGNVDLELFVNSSTPIAKEMFPVNIKANASKMSIGQERDAIEHPGKESFDGAIARFLIYDRPLSNQELEIIITHLKQKYNLNFRL
jgi:type 1 glutamine amidotransferase